MKSLLVFTVGLLMNQSVVAGDYKQGQVWKYKTRTGELVRESKEMPDISNGYAAWREPFDAGDAGVFDIPASKIVEYIEQVVNSAR